MSDKIGRENTMVIVFVGEGLALLGMNAYGHNPYAFLIFAPLIFLFWGEIFSIFPAICVDTFRSKYASSNAGTLHTAKGTAALLVPIASLMAAGGSWEPVLIGRGDGKETARAVCIAFASFAYVRYLAPVPGRRTPDHPHIRVVPG